MRPLVRYLTVLVVVAGCGPDRSTAPQQDDELCVSAFCAAVASGRRGSPDTSYTLLRLSTYDASGQVVHPDVVAVPPGWSHHSLFLAATPYPYSNEAKENPSVYTGDDGVAWAPAPSSTNPIAMPDSGHLSDPSIVFDPELSELWLYYRQATSANRIWLVRSRDGAHWSPPTAVITVPGQRLISPTVVRRGAHDWEMWSVNAGRFGCNADSAFVERRVSEDGVTWSEPTPVTLTAPVMGLYPWHLHVSFIESRQQYWAIFNAKVPGSCKTKYVFVATSPDGLRWTSRTDPVLSAGAIPQFDDIVYRATLLYEPQRDLVRLWFSGAQWVNRGYRWTIATQVRRRGTLFPEGTTKTFWRAMRSVTVAGGVTLTPADDPE